jgi:rRNA-processing protein FCF1
MYNIIIDSKYKKEMGQQNITIDSKCKKEMGQQNIIIDSKCKKTMGQHIILRTFQNVRWWRVHRYVHHQYFH